MRKLTIVCGLALLFSLPQLLSAAGVVYQGDRGPGKGKHVVLIASDSEYRSEEALPALGRILAKHYGFKCTVLFGVDENGFLEAGSSTIPGMEALDTADLMVMSCRFLDPPDADMQHFDDYLNRGGPVVGLRTSTHAFKIAREDAKFAKHSFQYPGKDFELGFGRQILGETWVGHYGKNHQQSTLLSIVPGKQSHPVMTGVEQMHVQSGGYFADPLKDCVILAMAQPLNGMGADDPADETKPPVPTSWVREYTSTSGKKGRVFTSTHGASEDILNDGYRRSLVNACLWTLGLEDRITPDGDISFVGPYQPTTFGGKKHKQGIKPSDVEGWDSPILP